MQFPEWCSVVNPPPSGACKPNVGTKPMTDTKHTHQHEAMDTILRYLIDNKSDRPIHSHTIWKEVFPEQDEEVVYFLLRKIMNTADEIVVSHIRSSDTHNFEVFFEANAITKGYLFDQGGFTGQFEREQGEQIDKIKREILEREKLESEVDIIRFQKGLGKKLTIWGFIIAVLSVIASVLTTLIQNQPNESLTRQIELVTQHADSLDQNLKSINLRLWNIEQKLKADTIK